jgi:hypothetical protein
VPPSCCLCSNAPPTSLGNCVAIGRSQRYTISHTFSMLGAHKNETIDVSTSKWVTIFMYDMTLWCICRPLSDCCRNFSVCNFGKTVLIIKCGFNFLVKIFLPCSNKFLVVILNMCRPGSSVGIVTGYRLDGPGIESRWGRGFPHLSRLVLGSTQPPV